MQQRFCKCYCQNVDIWVAFHYFKYITLQCCCDVSLQYLKKRTFRNVVAMLQFCKKILLQYCCNLSVLYGILLNFVLPLICIKLCNKYVKVYLISTIDMASYFVDKFCYISVSILSIRLYMSDLLSNL